MNHKQVRQAYGAPVNKYSDHDIEAMIEQVWNDLRGRVSRSDLSRVVQVILPRYKYARITTYVPLFVCREAMTTLRAGLAGATPDSPIQRPCKPRVDTKIYTGRHHVI